jgi:hypothetical protein
MRRRADQLGRIEAALGEVSRELGRLKEQHAATASAVSSLDSKTGDLAGVVRDVLAARAEHGDRLTAAVEASAAKVDQVHEVIMSAVAAPAPPAAPAAAARKPRGA